MAEVYQEVFLHIGRFNMDRYAGMGYVPGGPLLPNYFPRCQVHSEKVHSSTSVKIKS